MIEDGKVTKSFPAILAAVCASLIVALGACGGSGGNALRNTTWELASLSGSDLIPGTAITIEFTADEVSGSGGCNHYGGTYASSKNSLSLEDLYATEMACPEPEGVLTQEGAYLAALRAADSYQIAGDRLEVFDAAGMQILAFVASTSEGLAEVPTRTTAALTLGCTLKTDESYPAGEPVHLEFELQNQTDRPLYVLTWYTPLEGLAGDILRVTRDGEELPYQGPLAKRGDPTAEEYVAIEPGEVAAGQVDLRTGYDLSRPGSYQVQFTAGLQDVTDDAAAVPRKRDDHQPQSLSCNTVSFQIAPAPEPPTVTPTDVPPTAAPTEVPPTATPTPEPPAGSKQYVDPAAGVSLWIPESWVVTQVFPGESAILQSYPEDKYVGGEAREPGDTKCDVTIRPADVTLEGHMEQLRSNPGLTVVSEQEIVLNSGKPGIRVEVESLGPSVSLITEVNGRAVVLTCFGELAPFDAIALTVGAVP